MKHLLLLLAISLFAADAPPTKPISAAHKDALKDALIMQLHAQAGLLAYREEAKLESKILRELEERARAANDGWKAALATAQKADQAENCMPDLVPAGQWKCEAEKK